MNCLIKDCDKPLAGSFHCELHLLRKEAMYGLYDLIDNTYKDEEIEKEIKEWGVKRLINFVKYIRENGLLVEEFSKEKLDNYFSRLKGFNIEKKEKHMT